jgi:hypothetical protein
VVVVVGGIVVVLDGARALTDCPDERPSTIGTPEEQDASNSTAATLIGST